MDIGITGLPLVGKTTLFNALTGRSAQTGAYASKDAHRGSVEVPEPRLDALAQIFDPEKITPAVVNYTDVAGVTKGGASDSRASQLAVLRGVDALVHVVRGFESDVVPVPDEGLDPIRDVEDFDLELILADLEIAERRLDRLKKDLRGGDPEAEIEASILEKCRQSLTADEPIRSLEISDDERLKLRGFQFLTDKPVVVAINVGEDQAGQQVTGQWAELAKKPNTQVITICAELEMELAQLDENDRAVFQEDLGIEELALGTLIRKSYELLDLVDFFTAGPQEVRAWTLRKGSTALDAAGSIHSDLERGFIRAETVAFDELVECESFAGARDKGVLRLEGRAYVVKDGDVLTIRFNV